MSETLLTRRNFLLSVGGVSAALALEYALRRFYLPTGGIRVPAHAKVPGKMRFRARYRRRDKAYDTTIEWNVAETAIIVCDMWAENPCEMTLHRAGRMAARLNRAISKARDHGIMIIHAPTGGLHLYRGSIAAERIRQAPYIRPPVPIRIVNPIDPLREPPLPIDDSGPFQGCDDPIPRVAGNFDRHQHPAIAIMPQDGVSDDGQQIYNFFMQEGIRNVIMMGAATNQCLLQRSFGIRQLSYLEFNVLLARDLTIASYDSRFYPFVSHTRGTELIIEHIEKFWAPSFLSDDLHLVVPGTSGPPGLATASIDYAGAYSESARIAQD